MPFKLFICDVRHLLSPLLALLVCFCVPQNPGEYFGYPCTATCNWFGRVLHQCTPTRLGTPNPRCISRTLVQVPVSEVPMGVGPLPSGPAQRDLPSLAVGGGDANTGRGLRTLMMSSNCPKPAHRCRIGFWLGHSGTPLSIQRHSSLGSSKMFHC